MLKRKVWNFKTKLVSSLILHKKINNHFSFVILVQNKTLITIKKCNYKLKRLKKILWICNCLYLSILATLQKKFISLHEKSSSFFFILQKWKSDFRTQASILWLWAGNLIVYLVETLKNNRPFNGNYGDDGVWHLWYRCMFCFIISLTQQGPHESSTKSSFFTSSS